MGRVCRQKQTPKFCTYEILICMSQLNNDKQNNDSGLYKKKKKFYILFYF